MYKRQGLDHGRVGTPDWNPLGDLCPVGGRVAALGLFVVNAVAVLSLADIAPAALQQHQFWGSLLLALLLWGPGRSRAQLDYPLHQ